MTLVGVNVYLFSGRKNGMVMKWDGSLIISSCFKLFLFITRGLCYQEYIHWIYLHKFAKMSQGHGVMEQDNMLGYNSS